ncbi:hypothetical protein PCASD_11540 [Puccinia coronata f. sp. avenae]|nr:hypothetical protein PCASD_11540 [Puccinia coronata f. sp. avenae]
MDQYKEEGAAIVRHIWKYPWWKGGEFDPMSIDNNCIPRRQATSSTGASVTQKTHNEAPKRKRPSSPVPLRRIPAQSAVPVPVPLRGKMAQMAGPPRMTRRKAVVHDRSVGQEDHGLDDGCVTPEIVVIESDSSSTASTCNSIVWTKPMVSEFLNLYICEVVFAQRTDIGFPNSSHESVARQIRRSYPAVGHVKDVEIFKSKLTKAFRKDYDAMVACKRAPGFIWNAQTCEVTASDAIWKQYLQVNPDAQKFHGSPFAKFDKLDIIFSPSSPASNIMTSDSPLVETWLSQHSDQIS